MPALNFKKQFSAAVLNGTKHQTIRATRKHPIKVGDRLYLYTGMRTKQCQRLRVTRCTRVRPIVIATSLCAGLVRLNGRELNLRELTKLARLDGFRDAVEFITFFAETHGPNFIGQVIEWRS